MTAERSRAWQPLTFGGVARYAHDWIGRLIATCLVVSLLAASATAWTVRRAWLPVIEEAIAHCPPNAEIRGGRFTAPQVQRLAENGFLSIYLDPHGSFPLSSSDFQFTLTPNAFQFRSLFGRSSIPYPLDLTLVLSRSELDPKWAAWRPAVLGQITGGTIVGLCVTWIGLGVVYAIPVFLFSVLLGKPISPWGAWKLSVAALMPGAIFVSVALVLYGSGALRLDGLLVAFILHFVVGWLFLFGAVLWLPKKKTDNPFDRVQSDETLEPEAQNPFARKNSNEE